MDSARDSMAPPERHALRQEVMHRCPHVAPQVIDELFTQLDTDYFTLFTAPQIAAHVSLLAAVDDQHPVQVRVVPRSANSADILLAAYDLFGEFSLITGVMAVYGLNIRDGQVFTYQRRAGHSASWGHTDGGRIVDIFTVEYATARPFDSVAQAGFAAQLTALVQLLRQGKFPQARATLNYRLVDAIRASQPPSAARLFPVDIRLDNDASADWTVVHITADDTPGFLYSLSNALAMRNIYIHRVSISSAQGKVHDRLWLGWRRGGKITSPEGQRELRLMVVLIKQFTHFLTSAPDPVMALQHFDQFVDRLATHPSLGEDLHWLWEATTLKALATVLGSSDFLWDDFLRLHYDTLLPVLKDMDATDQHLTKEDLAERVQHALQTAATPAERKRALNTVKDHELFRIDMRHLLHPNLPFGLFAEELTDLAEVVLAGALDLAQEILQPRYGSPLLVDDSACAFALCGLGKLGGRELGYASDIEMLCVYSGQGTTSGPQRLAVSQYAELLVQQLLELIMARRAGIFEIDMRLRPFGSHGPLATSLEALQAYYRQGGQAAPFERQALIKLRWVAGNTALGQYVEAWRDAYVYSPEPFDLAAAVHLRQRQMRELVVPGTIDTKYSRGGLVDIEYTVQYLQLLHGATLPALRTTNTLHAMQALSQAGMLSATDYQHLQDAYRFLRHLIDALRIVRGNARDLVLPPTDSDEFIFLARRMGYWEDRGTPAQLARDIAHHMQQAARLYTERFLQQAAPG
jgi:glutamate-ammonia-ligase adenylyltransferase